MSTVKNNVDALIKILQNYRVINLHGEIGEKWKGKSYQKIHAIHLNGQKLRSGCMSVTPGRLKVGLNYANCYITPQII